MESLPERLKRAQLDSVPHSTHSVKIEVYVMQRVKGSRCHLSRHEEVSEIRTRKSAAGVALTILVRWPQVLCEARLLDR